MDGECVFYHRCRSSFVVAVFTDVVSFNFILAIVVMSLDRTFSNRIYTTGWVRMIYIMPNGFRFIINIDVELNTFWRKWCCNEMKRATAALPVRKYIDTHLIESNQIQLHTRHWCRYKNLRHIFKHTNTQATRPTYTYEKQHSHTYISTRTHTLFSVRRSSLL